MKKEFILELYDFESIQQWIDKKLDYCKIILEDKTSQIPCRIIFTSYGSNYKKFGYYLDGDNIKDGIEVIKTENNITSSYVHEQPDNIVETYSEKNKNYLPGIVIIPNSEEYKLIEWKGRNIKASS